MTASNVTLASRRHVAVELLLFAIGSALYLGLWRNRPGYADMTFGLAGMCLVLLLAWRTNERIWGAPLPDPKTRLMQSAWAMCLATAPSVVIFAIIGYWLAIGADSARTPMERFFRPTFFLSLPFYFLFGWLQQALVHYYLLGRIRILLPGASPWALALFNGVLFSLLHLHADPDVALLLLTMGGGIIWTLSYLRWRCLLPLAVSHMVLGVTYFYWVRDSDKMEILLSAFKAFSRSDVTGYFSPMQ